MTSNIVLKNFGISKSTEKKIYKKYGLNLIRLKRINTIITKKINDFYKEKTLNKELKSKIQDFISFQKKLRK